MDTFKGGGVSPFYFYPNYPYEGLKQSRNRFQKKNLSFYLPTKKGILIIISVYLSACVLIFLVGSEFLESIRVRKLKFYKNDANVNI